MAIAKKEQTCLVCKGQILEGEEIVSHPKLRRWVHPACAEENYQGGNEMPQSDNLQGLLDKLTPTQRGMFAPPQTEEEQKQAEIVSCQASLTRTLQIIVESMPFVHPDWLLSSVKELDVELKDLARLYFIQNAVSSIDKVTRLQDLLIAHSEKMLKDLNVEMPTAPERFTLDDVLRQLADRVAPRR